VELKALYKYSEVGAIPDEWDTRTVSAVSEVVRGGSPRPAGSPRYFNGDYIPWLTVAALTNIPDSVLDVSETLSCLTKEGSQYSRVLSAGTIVIANSGATLGVAKLLAITCCANDGIAALTRLREADKRFLCYYLNSQTKRLREIVATGNGQPNLNTGLIGQIPFPFPPAEEQRSIASALADIDALIGALKSLIAKKRDLKQAAMQHLLTGLKRLPGFTSKWDDERLGRIGAFSKGKGIRKDQVQSHGVPCVRYGEIYTRHNDYVRCFYSFITPEVAKDSRRLRKGDLLFAGSGETAEDIGKCVAYLGDEEAYAGGDTIIFSPVDSDSMFLGYLMNHASIAEQRACMGQGDAVVHISARSLADLRFRVPPREEQAAIAGVLSDMDAEVEALEARLTKTRLLKQGMMQELLTGRTRLV
jgi:type I restriction enzyme S subunit